MTSGGFRNPEPFIRSVRPTTVMVRSIAPGLVRNPGQTVRIVRGPVTGLVGSPTIVHPRMPAVAIVAYVLPIAIVIEVIDARNVIAHIVVAVVLARGIIVVRIVEITVVAAITAVIAARITIAIVVVNHCARLTRIDAR